MKQLAPPKDALGSAPARIERKPPLPPLAGEMKGGVVQLRRVTTMEEAFAHNDAMGGGSDNLVSYMAGQLLRITGDVRAGGPDRHLPLDNLNALIEIAVAFKPNNAVEAAFAVQATMTHHLALDCARRAAHAETLVQHTAHVNNAGKMARTFAQLVEALDRHRGLGPTQTVRVENVHVNGPAVVGSVIESRGVRRQREEQSHATATQDRNQLGSIPSLLGEDTARPAVHEPESERQAEMPHARRIRRRAEGQ